MTFGSLSGTPVSYTEGGFYVVSQYAGSGDHLHAQSGGLRNHTGCCSSPYLFRKSNSTAFSLSSFVRGTGGGTITSSAGGSQGITSGTNTFSGSQWTNITWFRWAGTGRIDNIVWTDCTAPNTAQAGGPYSVNEGGSVTLSASGSGQATLSYNWDFTGNGSYTNASGTSVTFNAASSAGSALDGTTTHTVGMRVTSSGCSGSSTDSATINVANVAPTASATIPSSGNEGSSLSFSGSGTDPGPDSLSYSWNFGDGGTSSSASPSHTFDDNGSYNVVLTVSDGDGGNSTASGTVTISNVNPNLASINGSLNAIEGDTKSYTATITDVSGADTTAGFSYSWSLTGPSPGQTSTSANPSFTFSDDGNHTLSLTVTDKDGGTDSATVTINVANANPTASIAGPTTGNEGQSLSFTGSATDPGADTFTYSWSFGDGGSAPGATVSHTYVDEGTGTYTVTLTVVDDDGGSDTVTQLVTVSNVNPTIDSFVVPASGVEAGVLSFTSTASDVGTADTLSYLWNFGDSNTSTAQNPTHIYQDEGTGTYTVTLTVTDNDGGSVSTNTTIPIANVNPVAGAIVGPSSGIEGQSLSWTGSGTDVGTADTLTYSWDFGDATSPSSGTSVTHTFANDGTYTITLTVTDNDGGSDTSTLVVTIQNIPPTVTAISGPVTGLEGSTLNFSATATDPGPIDQANLTWSWNWGDGTANGVGESPSHEWDDEGSYTVTATATDPGGLSGSDTYGVTISNVAPTIVTNPSAFAEEGVQYTYQAGATDPGADTISWTLAPSAPTGAVVNSASGLVEWTPTFAQLGVQAFTITADDGDGGTDVQSWTVQVGFTDADNDGMADTWETANGLDPTVDDSTLDPDGDGLTNLDEFLNGQDPNVSDLPDPPVLTSPIDGVEIDDPRPELVWDAAVDPNADTLTYDVELYEDQAMSLLVTSTSGVSDLSWPVDTQLSNENADYYWRARAHDGWGYGIWSDLEDFFLNEYNEPPGPPTAVYPVDGETIGTLDPAPEMIEGIDVDRDDVNHRIRIWSADGEELLTEGWIPAAARNVSWSMNITLEEDTWYAWDAQAEDEHGLTSDWMEIEDFFATSENAPPLDVRWLDPLDGDYVESVSPRLTYTESVDPEGRAVEYEIALDVTDTFDSGDLISVTRPHEGTADATWELSVDAVELTENTWWNARVRAVDQEDGTSAWDVIAFFVRGDNDPPPTPVLISPANGSTLTQRTPVLAIAHVEDPEEDLVIYEIMVARDAELTDIIGTVSDLLGASGPEGTADQTSWRTEMSLQGEVYWTARAVDERGAASEWADPWMLILDTGEPDALDPDVLLTGGCEACVSSISSDPTPERGLWLLLFLPLALRRRRA
jgi:PKD repeat protein